MRYFNKKEKAFIVSLLATEGKYSYSKGSRVFKDTSSFKLKRFLDTNFDEQKVLEDYIENLDVDWSKGSLIVDDTVIEKPYAKKIEPVYWQYSSKEGGFVMGINLTILVWSDGKQVIPICFMVYEKDENGKPLQTKNDFAVEALKYAHRA